MDVRYGDTSFPLKTGSTESDQKCSLVRAVLVASLEKSLSVEFIEDILDNLTHSWDNMKEEV